MSTKSKQLILAALIALLLHGLLLFFLTRGSKIPDLADLAKKNKIQVHLQVVQVAPPREEKIPPKADYLSEFNNRVKKQTQAANKTPTPTQNPPRKPVTPKQPKLGHGRILKHTLLPSWQELTQMAPPSSFNDHIEHTETGAQTELNTFEWKHAAYFNRIKESVSHSWSPLLQIKRYDPAGALIGKQDRLTVVEITIDTSGNVTHTQIKSSSNVFYLDDEAIAAFKRASPFPNPPKALFTSKQEFSFTFGFYVNVQKGFSLDFD